jgi:hypothetical protein
MRVIATVIIGLICTIYFVILGLQIISNVYDLFSRGQLDLFGKDDEAEPEELFWPADRMRIAKHLLGQIALATALIAVVIYSAS